MLGELLQKKKLFTFSPFFKAFGLAEGWYMGYHKFQLVMRAGTMGWKLNWEAS
jgi:hypothetical protein